MEAPTLCQYSPPPAAGGGAATATAAPGLKPQQPLLPFGPTLHYSRCGCPHSWAPGCRLCDWGDSYVRQAHASLLAAQLSPVRKLKVAYCIPHHNVTGGLKMLLEQMRLLRQRHHYVVALTRSELAVCAVPAWSDVQVDADVVCRLSQQFRDVYDVDSCDVIVTGIFHQVPEWLASTTAPVLYYEQGHEWLFGDPIRFQVASRYRQQDQLFHMSMHLPMALAAVSEAVQSIIRTEFGRSCLLVHNGVDSQRFCPGPRAATAVATAAASTTADATAAAVAPLATAAAAVATKLLTSPGWQPPAAAAAAAGVEEQRPSVLLVGNPCLPLKGFDCAIATLTRVNHSRPIQVHWVCQTDPSQQLAALIDSSGLQIHLHINPAQCDIPALYRGHDCFLFTSKYEAWGMPVLEAMASGLAVVSTACGGIVSFATPGLDCLVAPPDDAAELARAVLSVLGDAALRARLAAAARQTALRYSPDRVVLQLEGVLYSLAACRQELLALRLQALSDSRTASAAAVEACSAAVAAQRAQLQVRRQAAGLPCGCHPSQQDGTCQMQAAGKQAAAGAGEQAAAATEQRQGEQQQAALQVGPADQQHAGQQAGQQAAQQQVEQQLEGQPQAGQPQVAQQQVAQWQAIEARSTQLPPSPYMQAVPVQQQAIVMPEAADGPDVPSLLPPPPHLAVGQGQAAEQASWLLQQQQQSRQTPHSPQLPLQPRHSPHQHHQHHHQPQMHHAASTSCLRTAGRGRRSADDAASPARAYSPDDGMALRSIHSAPQLLTGRASPPDSPP